MSEVITMDDVGKKITGRSGVVHRVSTPVWFGERGSDYQAYYIIHQAHDGKEWIVNRYGEWIDVGYGEAEDVCPQTLTY